MSDQQTTTGASRKVRFHELIFWGLILFFLIVAGIAAFAQISSIASYQDKLDNISSTLNVEILSHDNGLLQIKDSAGDTFTCTHPAEFEGKLEGCVETMVIE